MARLTPLLAVVLLAACVVGPDYVQPELGPPATYWVDPANANVLGDGESLALSNWREIYDDPVLAALIEQALASNLELAIARSRLRQAGEFLIQARAPLYPQVGVSLNAEREKEFQDIENEHELVGFFAWELDLFGFNRRSAQAAYADRLSVEYTLYLQQVSLIGLVAETYFDFLDVATRIQIVESTIETRAEALRILSLRHDNGVISGLDVQQARVALASAEAALPALENRRFVLANALQTLVGQVPGELEGDGGSVAELWFNLDLPAAIPAGVPADLLLRRPDLLAAEADLMAATARVGVATADRFPRIALTGDYGLISKEFDDLLESASERWIIAGNITQPVFEAGARRAAVSAAEEARQQSLLAYRQTLLAALAEVSNSIDGYARSGDIFRTAEQLLDAAREYHRLANLQYREGVIGYIDVLDAQRQLLDAETSVSAARRVRLTTLSNVYRALGGGWSAPP
ncbi:MAG: efflux transporter outer membrane subunit [Pseudomonadota bacterium]